MLTHLGGLTYLPIEIEEEGSWAPQQDLAALGALARPSWLLWLAQAGLIWLPSKTPTVSFLTVPALHVLAPSASICSSCLVSSNLL